MLLTIGIIIGVGLFIGLLYLANRELKKYGKKPDFKLMWAIFSVSLCMVILVTMTLWMYWGHNNYPLSHYLKYDKFTPTKYYTTIGNNEVYEFKLFYKNEVLAGRVHYAPRVEFENGERVIMALHNQSGNQVYYLDEHSPRLANKFWKEIIDKHKTEFEPLKNKVYE